MYYVYLLTTNNNKTIYTGVTNNLERRLYEHKNKLVDGFTKRYNVDKLVYCEAFDQITDALKREKQIKSWTRERKNSLIESVNSNWDDLSQSWQ